MSQDFRGRVVPGEYFLVSTKLDTFCYPTVQTAPCRRFDTIPARDGQTDGIAVASTALAMRALRRAVKINMVAGTQLVNISTGKWTTRGYANSRIANSRPSQLAH